MLAYPYGIVKRGASKLDIYCLPTVTGRENVKAHILDVLDQDNVFYISCTHPNSKCKSKRYKVTIMEDKEGQRVRTLTFNNGNAAAYRSHHVKKHKYRQEHNQSPTSSRLGPPATMALAVSRLTWLILLYIE